MEGVVIKNKVLGTYYNGYAEFVKDIRDAKIYHTERGATNTMKLLVSKGRDAEKLVLSGVMIVEYT